MTGSKKNIFLFGGGLHGETCIDVIEKQGIYNLVGIIDSVRDIGSMIDGYPVLGRMTDLPGLAGEFDVHSGFIGIGDNWSRKIVADQVLQIFPEFEFVTLIHPTAVFGKNVVLGRGVLIAAQAFVSSNCTIGDFCFVHQQAHLGLLNRMGDFSSISGNSLTGGKVTLGEFTAVTLRVTVHDRLAIGAHSIIGSGSLVLKNIPDHVIAFGHPAKVISYRKEGDPYLKSG